MFDTKLKRLIVLASVALFMVMDVGEALAQGFGGFGNQAGPASMKASGVIVPPSGDQPAILVISGELEEDHYTYAITQAPGGPTRTKLKLDKSDSYVVGEFLPTEEPKTVFETQAFGNLPIDKHHGGAVWYAPLKLAEGVSIDQLQIKGKIYAQVCDQHNCFPPKDFAFVAKVGKSPVPLPKVKPLEATAGPSKSNSENPPSTATSDSAKSNLPNPVPVTEVSPPMPASNQTAGQNTSDAPPGLDGSTNPSQSSSQAPPGLTNDKNQSTSSTAEDYDVEKLTPLNSNAKDSSLPVVLAAAFFAGLILNVMPCVLPVIGLKLLSFLEQGGNNPRRVLALNLWYSLGIISVFWVLAGISVGLQAGLGKTFGIQQTSFGWGEQFKHDSFNIALVSIVFVMALSFLGVWEIPIPGFAGGRNAQDLARKEGAVGAFSKGVITTVLATPCSGPFLGTAVGFALKSPPMMTFVVFTLMGVGMAAPYILVGFRPELMRFLPKPGAWMDTFKQLMGFVLIGTVLWLIQPIDDHLLMPTLVLLTGLGAACWWIGRTPGYAELSEKLKAWAQATVTAGIIGSLAFAMPQVTDPLPWKKFNMGSFASDVNQGKTVLVEFTAEWCATCKTLKAANLDRTKTKATITKNEVVVYEVDIDHLSDQEQSFFSRLQPSQGVPLVAIFPSGKKYQPILFGNGYTQAQILSSLQEAGPSQTAKP